ncbi:hypothetical protein [Natrinema ejinorense]|nr:hypothetical protein [Natrinema ejinorense]
MVGTGDPAAAIGRRRSKARTPVGTSADSGRDATSGVSARASSPSGFTLSRGDDRVDLTSPPERTPVSTPRRGRSVGRDDHSTGCDRVPVRAEGTSVPTGLLSAPAVPDSRRFASAAGRSPADWEVTAAASDRSRVERADSDVCRSVVLSVSGRPTDRPVGPSLSGRERGRDGGLSDRVDDSPRERLDRSAGVGSPAFDGATVAADDRRRTTSAGSRPPERPWLPNCSGCPSPNGTALEPPSLPRSRTRDAGGRRLVTAGRDRDPRTPVAGVSLPRSPRERPWSVDRMLENARIADPAGSTDPDGLAPVPIAVDSSPTARGGDSNGDGVPDGGGRSTVAPRRERGPRVPAIGPESEPSRRSIVGDRSPGSSVSPAGVGSRSDAVGCEAVAWGAVRCERGDGDTVTGGIDGNERGVRGGWSRATAPSRSDAWDTRDAIDEESLREAAGGPSITVEAVGASADRLGTRSVTVVSGGRRRRPIDSIRGDRVGRDRPDARSKPALSPVWSSVSSPAPSSTERCRGVGTCGRSVWPANGSVSRPPWPVLRGRSVRSRRV